jgi:hypothetical protein
VIWPIEPNEAPDNRPKIFSILVSNRLDIRLFVHSAYFQYTYRSIPRILSIQTDSFCIFSVYEQSHSAYSQYTNSEISFEYLPHSAYSLYTYRFFPRICSIRTDSIPVFSEYIQIHSEYWRMHPNSFEYLECNGVIFFSPF